MEQRTYRGGIDPDGLADALVARFNHGDLMAQKVIGPDGHVMVQIATRDCGNGARHVRRSAWALRRSRMACE